MKRIISLLMAMLIILAMFTAAFAETANASVTDTTDAQLAAIVNAAYQSGEYEYQEVYYAQQMIDKLIYLNRDAPKYGKDADGTFRRGTYLLEAAIHTLVPEGIEALVQEDIANLKNVAVETPTTGEYKVIGSFDPARIGEASSDDVIAVYQSGEEKAGMTDAGYVVLSPVYAFDGELVAVLEQVFRNDGHSEYTYRNCAIYNLKLIDQTMQNRSFLFDPYSKGFKAEDTLVQKINQILVKRHPEVSVIATHLTNFTAGETTNMVTSINRPNFLMRESDAIDTDTELSSKIVMQVIPNTNRMEVHMPLFDKAGLLIGSIVTVYTYDDISESADFYGRSLDIMVEASQLMPLNRDELFGK